MNPVKKMLQYINNNDISMIIDIKYDSISDFNSAIISLLEWLKLQYKRQLWFEEGKKDLRKPLSIPLETSWGLLLVKIIKSNDFNKYFDINANEVSLSSNLSDGEKKELYKTAYDGYNPVMFIK